jgi:hypothetical protein
MTKIVITLELTERQMLELERIATSKDLSVLGLVDSFVADNVSLWVDYFNSMKQLQTEYKK